MSSKHLFAAFTQSCWRHLSEHPSLQVDETALYANHRSPQSFSPFGLKTLLHFSRGRGTQLLPEASCFNMQATTNHSCKLSIMLGRWQIFLFATNWAANIQIHHQDNIFKFPFIFHADLLNKLPTNENQYFHPENKLGKGRDHCVFGVGEMASDTATKETVNVTCTLCRERRMPNFLANALFVHFYPGPSLQGTLCKDRQMLSMKGLFLFC